MAPRHDDMEQRRQKRAALGKKRRKEQKALRRKLIMAAVIFLASLALVIWLTRNDGTTQDPGQMGETPTDFRNRVTGFDEKKHVAEAGKTL